jgi:hypothetical protein
VTGTADLTLNISAAEQTDEQRRMLRLARLSLDRIARPRPPRWPVLLAILTFVLGFLAGAKAYGAEPPVKFLQPRVPVVLAPPTGTEIPVQVRIEPNAGNRAYAIAWCDGVHAHSLDGADEAAVQPAERPLMVRLGPGDCTFTASVFGVGGALRARTSFVMHVCAGQEDCVPGVWP